MSDEKQYERGEFYEKPMTGAEALQRAVADNSWWRNEPLSTAPASCWHKHPERYAFCGAPFGHGGEHIYTDIFADEPLTPKQALLESYMKNSFPGSEEAIAWVRNPLPPPTRMQHIRSWLGSWLRDLAEKIDGGS